MGALYRNLTAPGGGGSLPDYLLLVDDDTYVNLPLLLDFLRGSGDPSVPAVYAGCLFSKKMSFGFGGFGLFYSRGAVDRMIRPVTCDGSESGYEEDICARVRESLVNEGPLFRPGMSVSDLMAALSASDGLCMHSDWLTGYFVNVYGLSGSSDARPDQQQFGYNRLTALAGTEFGADFKARTQNICDGDSAMVCHQMTPHPGETEEEVMEKDQGVSVMAENMRENSARSKTVK